MNSLANISCEAVLPVTELKSTEEIERSIQKKYRKYLWSPFIKAAKEFSLVEDGDRIAGLYQAAKTAFFWQSSCRNYKGQVEQNLNWFLFL